MPLFSVKDFQRLNPRVKADGMFEGHRIFDKGESAKVILDVTTGRNDSTSACELLAKESSGKTSSEV